MIIWGSGGGKTNEGTLQEVHQCEVCNNINQPTGSIYYRYFHMWYLFSFLTSQRYVYECSHCNNGYLVKKSDFKNNFPKNKVPFIRKFGALICLTLIAVLVAFASYENSKNDALTDNYISAPRINDHYYINLAKVKDSGYEQNTNAYGIIKLSKKLDNNSYYFLVPSLASDQKSGLSKFLSENKVEYESDSGLILTQQQLKSLKNQKIIYDVKR